MRRIPIATFILFSFFIFTARFAIAQDDLATDSEASTKPKTPSVCGDGKCDEGESARCARDCEAKSADAAGNPDANTPLYIPRTKLEDLQKEVDELKAKSPTTGAQQDKPPALPTVCGDGTCDDSEKGHCDSDCSTSSDAEGYKSRYVNRSEVQELQKQLDELKAKPPTASGSEPVAKPAGPSVCGDGLCDDKEKGRCERDCGS